jgi:hypothetical protein
VPLGTATVIRLKSALAHGIYTPKIIDEPGESAIGLLFIMPLVLKRA